MYNELIEKDADAVTNEEANDPRKYNVLNIL